MPNKTSQRGSQPLYPLEPKVTLVLKFGYELAEDHTSPRPKLPEGNGFNSKFRHG